MTDQDAEAELLRRRLYQRAATDDDAAAYAARRVRVEAAAGPGHDAGPGRAAAGRRPAGRRVLLAGAVVAAAAVMAALVREVPRGGPARRTRGPSTAARPEPLGGAGMRRAAAAALGAGASPAAVAVLERRIRAALQPRTAPGAAVMTFQGRGAARLRLGALGIAAGGRSIEVAVAVPGGRYSWTLVDGAATSPPAWAAAAGDGVAPVSSAAAEVPRGGSQVELRLRVAAARSWCCVILLPG